MENRKTHVFGLKRKGLLKEHRIQVISNFFCFFLLLPTFVILTWAVSPGTRKVLHPLQIVLLISLSLNRRVIKNVQAV